MNPQDFADSPMSSSDSPRLTPEKDRASYLALLAEIGADLPTQLSMAHTRVLLPLIERERARVAGMPVFRYLDDGRTFTIGTGDDTEDVDLSDHWDAALVCWLTLSGPRGREDISSAYAAAAATRLDSLRHKRQRFADYLEHRPSARRLAAAVRHVEISQRGFRLKRAVQVDTGDPYTPAESP
jgi:hypothetical protein